LADIEGRRRFLPVRAIGAGELDESDMEKDEKTATR